jgi:hypothetical protein
MRRTLLPALAMILALPAAAQAQSPHFGVALNLLVPTGEFNQSELHYVHPTGGPSTIKEGYDTGLGAQFWVSLPVNRTVAFRFNLSGSSNDGSYDDPNYPRYNARQTMFSIGTELQLFLQEGAFSHKGSYLYGGIAADFERFDLGYGDLNSNGYYYNSDIVDTTRKTRLGGNFGFGHSFGYAGGVRFNMEVGYHATLQDRKAGDPPKSDSVKIGFGIVF